MPLCSMSKAATSTDTYDHHFLPQLGFGSDINFDSIVRYHRYLFRVYTPKSRLPAVEDDTLFFVGPRFDKFAPQTPVLSEMSPSCGPLVETATYEDCIQHLNWETRSRSPFISTSFSFSWVIWDALRRFNNGVKHDVEIAVIDAGSAFISGRAVTTLQLLRRGPSSSSRHPFHWKWCRFAQESQSVLIYGFIPRSAVLASIPLRAIIQNLPSYFLKTPSMSLQNQNQSIADLPLDQILAWDFTKKRNAGFRRFCQEMGDRFTRMPYTSRVREVAVGSVRLALAMLRPWFDQSMDKGDIQSGVARVRDLSALIAHWPEQPGSQAYAEMASLMRALIQLLVEEVQGGSVRSRKDADQETSHLQQMVDSLLEVIHIRNIGNASHEFGGPARSSHDSEPQPIILGSFSERGERGVASSSPSSSSHRSRSGLTITIPDSSASSSSCPSSAAPLTPKSVDSETSFVSPFSSKNPSFSHLTLGNPPSPDFSSSSIREGSPPPSPLVLPQPEAGPLPSASLRISIPLRLPSPDIMSSPSAYYSAMKSPPFELPLVERTESDETFDFEMLYSDSIADYSAEEEDDDASNATTLQETVSYAVTGFLIGAFITLSILSSQRRTLLYVT